MRVLITGGAGFVGGNLAVALAERQPDWEIVALDNLMRRGSELNLPRLREAGVEFVHGDVREPADLTAAGPFDAMVECSAEPSVLAGFGDPSYSVQTNLLGAFNCLERARAEDAFVVFLSTSRVYPVAPQLELELEEAETRFELSASQPVAGAGPAGIAEDFPLTGARTLYGATKLSAELLIEEYADAFGLRAVINRCGVIAGPWQMGKVDQGVFSWWLLSHHFGRAALLHRLRRLRQAGARPAPRRRPGRPGRASSSPTRSAGAASPPTSAAAASAASRCWRRRRSAAS